MSQRDSKAITAIVALAMIGGAAAQTPQDPLTGSAIVRVETDPPGAPGNFTFTGVPGGTIVAGGNLTATALGDGSYSTTASTPPPGLALVSISCDDGASQTPSRGAVPARTANFEFDRGETVTCVFRYRKVDLAEESTRSAGSKPQDPGAPAKPGTEPGSAPGGMPAGSESCVAPAMVPKAGKWNISNLPGRMVCGTMVNMPLTPSQETGTLTIQDCGWTVVGTPMAEGNAPLTMRAVDNSGSVYTGTVGGMQDGIPMTIEFTWNLNSDEWIVGDLKSSVTQQGMTCNMSRPFELRYSGG
ncbi:MAG: hypothetical protein EHM68_10015 [Lysobacterales bacterium]|nr:MAG: hypothetical protein EHM68_10015 [Xanthomonadales bacterium]